MTKTKTIPLEVPEDWEFERATYIGIPVETSGYKMYIANCRFFKPLSWSWCESPTDEMAKLRPDCEVRDFEACNWQTGRTLLAVLGDGTEHLTHRNGSVATWRYCRVRIDNATGRVIERWE